MKKILSILILVVFLFTSCVTPRTFYTYEKTQQDSTEIVEEKLVEIPSYGILNPEAKRKGVVYEVSVGNIILSVLFVETIIVPVVLTGFFLNRPLLILDHDKLNEDINKE